ncbi:MAG: hypothetical protein HOM96_02160, partial [Rickettsiales bacterium]|nr:hypothetical protein [Rickettsiales bacterium]
VKKQKLLNFMSIVKHWHEELENTCQKSIKDSNKAISSKLWNAIGHEDFMVRSGSNVEVGASQSQDSTEASPIPDSDNQMSVMQEEDVAQNIAGGGSPPDNRAVKSARYNTRSQSTGADSDSSQGSVHINWKPEGNFAAAFPNVAGGGGSSSSQKRQLEPHIEEVSASRPQDLFKNDNAKIVDHQGKVVQKELDYSQHKWLESILLSNAILRKPVERLSLEDDGNTDGQEGRKRSSSMISNSSNSGRI